MKKIVIILAIGAVLGVMVGVFSLIAHPKEQSSVPSSVGRSHGEIKTALFANGCFWCVESDMEKINGVVSVISGYAGGGGENPTYDTYASTGHREVVEVTYDPLRVSYGNLVESLIKHGDPTDGAGSFYDRGEQYAPAIYFENEEEHAIALDVIAAIDASGVLETPIAVAVLPRVPFWAAEDYHQDYYLKNPIRYSYYRSRSGRDTFIDSHWGSDADRFTFSTSPSAESAGTEAAWLSFKKPPAAELRKMLTPEQFRVTQENGTEKPFTNEYNANTAEGIYVDSVSGEPLFSSHDKYDSGTSWPSFVKPISPESVTLHEDRGLFFTRTEVRSKYADSHLGHVFNDGPAERGGKRYCMNSAALRFVPKDEMIKQGYGDYLYYVNSL